MPEVSMYSPPGLTIAPEIAKGRNKPIGQLAQDANVNAAYQALMSAVAQGDLDRDFFKGQLQTNLGRSQQERSKALLASNQSLSDRGMLNSGAALGKQADIGTQYDAYDTDLTNNINNAINGIDIGIRGLETGYENEQIAGSGRWTAQQAAAADAAIKRQQEIDANETMMQSLMAALAPQPTPAPYDPPEAPAPYYHGTPAPAQKLKPKPAPVPSGTTGRLVSGPRVGPQ